MNYTQMFANGGKTSDQDLIKGIQKILGVDDAQMEQLLQVGINKYGSLEGIGQALSQATQGLTQNSSPEEVQAAVASVFQTNAESQMFKCGGKLQQLVSRFGKGGPVDCGCGGIKIGQEGFKTSGSGTDPDAGFHTGDIEITPQKDTIVNYSYPSYNGKAILTPNGGTVKEWLNGDSLPTVYRDRNWFARHPRRALLPFIGNLNNAKIMNARELAQNHIPSQQEGGVMLEQMPGYDVNTNLTRRQARQLAAQNQGYSGEQFNFAMANAINALRNQGLRGKELRERAREMAAGISPVQRTIVEAPVTQQLPEGFGNVAKITAPAQLVLPETQALLDSMLDQTNATLTKRLQTSGKRTSDQKPVFTGSTSAQKKAPTTEQQARIARGQAREQASNATRAKAQQTPVQPSQSIVDTPDYTTGYMGTPEASKYYVHASNGSSLFDNPYAVRMPSAPVQQTSTSQQYPLTGNEARMAQTIYGVSPRPITKSTTDVVAIPVSKKQGGQVEKGQGGFPNGILTDKITTVKGPSIGQHRLGVIRPGITQHIVYNQQANPDTLYFGKNVNAFDSSLPVNITDRETTVLPQSVKNKLANIVDSDYNEYNTSRGSYPNGYYEKTIDTKYKKK